jgi:GrpB-like predicted nucleotidyltransferase (UPF0157 family)
MLIVTYRSEWVNHFEAIKQKLSASLAGLAVSIEHVGSTSVPNLDAKPIIDVDIIHNEPTDFENIKTQLESLGYFHNGNQDVEGREVFKRNGDNADAVLDHISHHLYVCQLGCVELQRHLLFRDYLRKHDTARDFYQHLKYKIAIEANQDRKLYAAIKEMKANSFIDYCISLERHTHS